MVLRFSVASPALAQTEVRAGAVLPDSHGPEPQAASAVPQPTDNAYSARHHLVELSQRTNRTTAASEPREEHLLNLLFQHPRDFATNWRKAGLGIAFCNIDSTLLAEDPRHKEHTQGQPKRYEQKWPIQTFNKGLGEQLAALAIRRGFLGDCIVRQPNLALFTTSPLI